MYPATFSAPSEADLAAIGAGSFVQVCPATLPKSERFWVQVEATSDSALVGSISQDCVLTHVHGLSDQDQIEFERRHIYKIYPTSSNH